MYSHFALADEVDVFDSDFGSTSSESEDGASQALEEKVVAKQARAAKAVMQDFMIFRDRAVLTVSLRGNRLRDVTSHYRCPSQLVQSHRPLHLITLDLRQKRRPV